MSEHAAFVRSILAAPDDDLPRLVYADFLDEHGDPRGEFIRVQLAIAALADEPRCDASLYGAGPPRARDRHDAGRLADLRARELRLLTAHIRTWVAPLGPAVTGVRFWRGFIDTVRCPAAAFLADGELWAESVAIRRLRLFAVAGSVDALAATPLLAPVRSMEVESGVGCEDVLLALARSPFAARLREVYLHGSVSDVAARAILHSPNLTGLTTFAATGRSRLSREAAYAMRRRFGGRW